MLSCGRLPLRQDDCSIQRRRPARDLENSGLQMVSRCMPPRRICHPLPSARTTGLLLTCVPVPAQILRGTSAALLVAAAASPLPPLTSAGGDVSPAWSSSRTAGAPASELASAAVAAAAAAADADADADADRRCRRQRSPRRRPRRRSRRRRSLRPRRRPRRLLAPPPSEPPSTPASTPPPPPPSSPPSPPSPPRNARKCYKQP